MKLALLSKPICLAIITSLIIWYPHLASGITVKEEKELSKEFMKFVAKRYEIIDDPVIENYINKIGDKILSVVPTQPFDYDFYVIREDVFNAFATPAGKIFINSGLFLAFKNEEELAGVIAHEIAHVTARHISERIEASKKINMATLAGVVAGVFLGAGGAATAGNAVAVGSVAAGQSLSLAYTRENEMQADQLGLRYLTDAGYSGEGLLRSLEIIRSKQWFSSKQIPTYLTTHPASEDRISYLDNWIQVQSKKAGSKTIQQVPNDPSEFNRVQIRLTALYSDEAAALKKMKSAIEKNPEDPLYHYGYALVLERGGNHKEALFHIKKALEKNALDPLFLQELGIVYYHSGQYEEALSTLEGASGLAPNNPSALFYLGRTNLKLDNNQRASQNFEDLIKLKPNHIRAYYYLGESESKQGNLAEAHYNLGIYYYKKTDLKNSMFHLSKALDSMNDPEKRRNIQDMLAKLKKQKKSNATK